NAVYFGGSSTLCGICPPKLGQNMDSTTTVGMAWTAPRFSLSGWALLKPMGKALATLERHADSAIAGTRA
ncbi:hypothetical protein ACT3TJ_17805, partial [Halomonas sp. AOP30-A1-24]|uniref:hypothetical protein n=1 Tax=Halomonas sp. AOP30-A1-24 TaxID=3457698 RepID=UPI004034C5D4